MKKLLFLLILVGILLINPAVNAEIIETSSGYIVTDAVSLKTAFVNQDPYPAEPGGYVDLLFKLENWGTEEAENVVFELLPEYPFSLDPRADATKELGTIRGLQKDEKAFLLKYKVRVDEDAIDGENEIKVKYTYGTGTVSSIRTFDITISDPKTDFDVVVQDSTETSTTLAIANIGANTAYSVIVKVPEQESFRVMGVSANVMGNLDAGDYTLVSFQIIPIDREKNLIVEISYTDTLGIRRMIQKEVRLDMIGTIGEGTGARPTHGSQSQMPGASGLVSQIPISSGLMYIGIGIVGIIGTVAFLKFRKRVRRKKK